VSPIAMVRAGQALTSKGADSGWRQFVTDLRPSPELSAELEHELSALDGPLRTRTSIWTSCGGPAS
jgi:hypothetical protein